MPPNGYYAADNSNYDSPQGMDMGEWEPSPNNSGYASPRTAAGFELADPRSIDPDVRRQLEAGLIDINEMGDYDSDRLGRDAPTQVFRRKVKKLVEVPVTRKVKVATTESVVVPCAEKRTVMVKKQVPVQVDKWVEEAFTDIEPRQATRMKEVWVKKMVPENYTKNVEVRKTRKVKVPETIFKEVEEEKVIEVEGSRIENQPAWRVDEIKDTKMVEIEGWQEVEMVPRIRDANIKVERTFEREQGRRRVERKIGTNVIENSDTRLDEVDTDSDNEHGGEYTSAGPVRLDGSERRTKPKSGRSPTRDYSSSYNTTRSEPMYVPSPPKTARPLSYAPPPTSSSPTEGFHSSSDNPYVYSSQSSRVPAAPPLTSPAATSPKGSKMFGLRMSARKEGLLVTEVAQGGFASDAGLLLGDLIVAVDGTPVNTVKSWRNILAGKKNGDMLNLNLKQTDGRTRSSTILLDGFNPAHYL